MVEGRKFTTVRFRDQDGFLHIEACGESWDHSEPEAKAFLKALKEHIAKAGVGAKVIVMVEPEPDGEPGDGEWDTVIHHIPATEALIIVDVHERGIAHMEGKWA